MCLPLTKENIKNHFLSNPVWKRVFLENYPDWTPENYSLNVKALFEKNGYTFKVEKELKNERIGHLVRMDLYGPPADAQDDGFVFGKDWVQCSYGGEIRAVEQIFIPAICEYIVDFTNWK